MRQRRFVTVVMLLLPGCGTRAAPATNADAALRSALLSRRARDQAVRDTFTVQLRETGTLTLALVRSMNAVDSANLAWLRQTVGSVGFPSRARVGIGGVRVMVLDTGVGISADDLPFVFDRFWQSRRTDRSGAGLGLAIAHGIVRAHGGTLTRQSEVGRGTTALLTLPAAGEPPAVGSRTRARLNEGNAKGWGMTIRRTSENRAFARRPR